MKWGAHEVDGRIAARAAVKIRAALRQSIDAKRVYELYLESQPAVTDNPAQDNARARAWAMLNIRPNNNPLLTALENLWAEAFILGEDSAQDAIRQAREAKKAAEGEIDWSKWKAGDRKSALLITPPNAFRRLLEKQSIVVKGLDKTGYDRVGTALARSIRLGLGATSAAKQINDAIGDPARALTIAITETNRAVSLGAIKTYKDAHLEKMEWQTSDPCPECAQNSEQVIDIGGTFRSGAQQPPAHPHCRCALLPVIPDYETNEAGVVDVAPAPIKPEPRAADLWDRKTSASKLQAPNTSQRAMNEIYAKYTPTADQVDALRAYQESAFFKINADLRGGKPPTEMVAVLDSLIESAPQPKGIFQYYRTCDSNVFDGMTKGSMFIDEGFTSVSISAEEALRFGEDAMYDAKVRIIDTANRPKVWVDAITDDPGKSQLEVVFGRGTPFTYVGVDEQGYHVLVTGRRIS